MLSTRRLTKTALFATVLLITLGGYTRGSGSGYGCSDRWPLCENGLLGGLLPRFEYHMVVEWTHRWVAALVGLLLLAAAISAIRSRPRNRWVVWPTATAVVAVGIQGWLGRQVVKGNLDKDLVSLHLTVSITIAALLVLAHLAASPPRAASTRRWAILLGIGAGLSYGVLLLGSLVHNLFIDGWPFVHGDLIPDLSNRYVALHWWHRLVAGGAALYAGWLARRATRHPRPETPLVLTAATAFAINVGLGLLHVLTEVSSATVVALHLLCAVVAWLALVGATAIAAGWGGTATAGSTPTA